jgi:IS5 family transposase
MVRRAYQQRSLVEVLLPDADKLWDPTLRRIDALLDDESLVDRVTEALAQRHPQSQRRGRLGTPAAVVLRILVLKHLYDWSFDECEREVRGSLVYRAFCRIDGERVPDAKTLIRLAHVLDPTVLKDLLAQLVLVGRAKRIIHGRRLRVDTTVVETNIHYPTDATLLGDGAACSRARCAGWGSGSDSAPAASAAGSSRSPSAVARPAPESVRRCARRARRA